VSEAWPLPAVTDGTLGALGVVAGVTEIALEKTPGVTPLRARTVTRYWTPFVIPPT
jgi:hypothetical protein